MSLLLQSSPQRRTANDLSDPDLVVPTHEPSQTGRFSVATRRAVTKRCLLPIPRDVPEAESPSGNLAEPTTGHRLLDTIHEESSHHEPEPEMNPEALLTRENKPTSSKDVDSPTLTPRQSEDSTTIREGWSWRPFFTPSFRLKLFGKPLSFAGDHPHGQGLSATIHMQRDVTLAPPREPTRTAVSSTADSSSSRTSSAALTPLSSVSSRTSIDNHCVTVPINSSSIYCWNTERKIYIGKLKDISPPKAMETEWVNNIRVQLLSDLRMVIQSLPRSLSKEKTTVEPELYMVGEANDQSDSVELKPTVWIRCGSRKCKKAVAEAVDDLKYVHAFSKGRVQIHRGAPRLASSYASSTTRIVITRPTADSIPSQPSGSPRSTGAPPEPVDNSTPQLIATLVGVLVPLLIATMVIVFLLWRKRRRRGALKREQSEPWETTYMQPVYQVTHCRISELESEPPDSLEHSIGSHYNGDRRMSTFPPIEGPPAELYSAPPSSISVISSNTPQTEEQDCIQRARVRERIGRRVCRSFAEDLPQPPGMTSTAELPSDRQYPYQFSKPAEIQVDVSVPVGMSAVGSRVKFTIRRDGVVQERTSTIGGFIEVNNRLYGLTTAHAVAELLFDKGDEDLSSRTSDLVSGSDSERSFETIRHGEVDTRVTEKWRSESSTFSAELSAERHDSATTGSLAYQANMTKALLYAFSFAGQKHLPTPRNPFSVSKSSDFALIELERSYTSSPNRYYQHRNEGNLPVGNYTVRNFTPESAGPVHILCSPFDIRPGYVLDGDSFFLDRTTMFSTKKIQTEAPLERGLSGAWVICGGQLAGIIIAVYDNEPYAHMLPIGQVFSDIKAVLSGGISVPTIGLPGEIISHANLNPGPRHHRNVGLTQDEMQESLREVELLAQGSTSNVL